MNDPSPQLPTTEAEAKEAVQEASDVAEDTATEVALESAASEPVDPAPAVAATEPTKVDIKAIGAKIQANYDFNVDVKAVTFHFKKVKDEETGTEVKRASIELALPYPSVQGIIDILEGSNDTETRKDEAGNDVEVEINKNHDRQMELLMEAVESVVTTNARALIADDESITAENLDVSKLSWLAIACMPKTTRTGGGIPKEIWEAFVADYVDIMPEVTGKKLVAIQNAGKIILNKFAAVKTNHPVLEMLVDQLAIYMENSADAEVYAENVAFLLKKADELMNITDEQLLAAL